MMTTEQDQVGVFVGRQWQRVSAIMVFVFPSLQEQKQNREKIESTKASSSGDVQILLALASMHVADVGC